MTESRWPGTAGHGQTIHLKAWDAELQEASMTGLDRYRRTGLHYAALENDVERIASHLAAGDGVDAQDVQGFTALHFACQENAVEAARLLLDRGASVDVVNRFGNTPLFNAVFSSKGVGDLIPLLRSRGADPYSANKHGQTPLGLARLIANYDVAQFFADLEG